MRVRAFAVLCLFAVAGLLALPLYSAMQLCEMRCCHDESTDSRGCGRECGVRGSRELPAAVAPDAPKMIKGGSTEAPCVASPLPRITFRSAASAPARFRAIALHLMNATFRI
jgi:hypothetical protein